MNYIRLLQEEIKYLRSVAASVKSFTILDLACVDDLKESIKNLDSFYSENNIDPYDDQPVFNNYNCNCGALDIAHPFGTIGCEHHDHHCEHCHKNNICTKETCK